MKTNLNRTFHALLSDRRSVHEFILRKFIVLLLLFIVHSIGSSGQVLTPTEDVAAFEENKTFYLHAYPHILEKAEITGIERLNEKHTKIYYTEGINNYETVVNSARKDLLLIATCMQIPLDKLPAIVRDVAKKTSNDKMKIINAFKVQTPYSSEFYRVDIQSSDSLVSQTKALFFDQTGQYVEPPY